MSEPDTTPGARHVGRRRAKPGDGNSHGTGVEVQPGYQARYLSWDTVNGQYVVVAQTAGFPNTTVCSS